MEFIKTYKTELEEINDNAVYFRFKQLSRLRQYKLILNAKNAIRGFKMRNLMI